MHSPMLICVDLGGRRVVRVRSLRQAGVPAAGAATRTRKSCGGRRIATAHWEREPRDARKPKREPTRPAKSKEGRGRDFERDSDDIGRVELCVYIVSAPVSKLIVSRGPQVCEPCVNRARATCAEATHTSTSFASAFSIPAQPSQALTSPPIEPQKVALVCSRLRAANGGLLRSHGNR